VSICPYAAGSPPEGVYASLEGKVYLWFHFYVLDFYKRFIIDKYGFEGLYYHEN